MLKESQSNHVNKLCDKKQKMNNIKKSVLGGNWHWSRKGKFD